MFSLTLLIGCGINNPTILTGSEGIPDETFRGIKPEYADGSSVGNLTEAYIQNTEALNTVNGRLDVLCKANEIEDCGPR